MNLTGKKKASLRSIGHNLDPVLHIGKGNINEAVIAQTDELLENKELIKGAVLRSSELTAKEACEELASKTNAEVIQVIGNKFMMYRKSQKLKKQDKNLKY